MQKILLVIIFICLLCKINFAQTGICFNNLEDNLYHTGIANDLQVVGDVNNDGYTDVISACQTGSISVTLGNAGTLSAPSVFYVGGQPASPVLGDLNNDGKQDLVFSSYNTNKLTIMLGQGNGTFITTFTMSVGGIGSTNQKIILLDANEDSNLDLFMSNSMILLFGDGLGNVNQNSNFSTFFHTPTDIISLDFNNDGHKDLALLTQSSSQVNVYYGDGQGLFTLGYGFTVTNNPSLFTSSDINSDGNPDFLVTYNGFSPPLVFFGNGAIITSSVTASSATFSRKASVSDLDSDGNVDLISLEFGRVVILKGNGSGQFIETVDYTLVTNNTAHLNLGDLDNDGNMDLIISPYYLDYCQIMLSNGNCFFSALPINKLVNRPNAFVIGDFDNDGFKDVVVAEEQNYGISMLKGNGTQNLNITNTYTLNKRPVSIAKGDFNNDGNLDVITANDTSNNVSLFLGDGIGNFLAPLNYTVGLSSKVLKVVPVDFNNDGNLDFITANNGTMSVSVFEGLGNGNFLAPINFTLTIYPLCIDVGDFNNDNIKDIVVGGNSLGSKNYAILIGNGLGSFSISEYNFGVSTSPCSVDVDDMNNDGFSDFVFSSYLNTDKVSVLLGNGMGTFSLSTTFTNVITPKSIIVGDVNNDGNKDIVAMSFTSNGKIVVFLGAGSGTFSSPIILLTQPWPGAIALDNFDNNSSQDIIFSITNANSYNLGIYLNSSASISSVGSTSICVGGKTVLTASALNSNYLWQPGAITTNTILISNPGTYSLTTSNLNGSCLSTSKVFTVQLNSSLAPSVSISPTTNTLCLGSSLNLSAGGANTYTWSTGATSYSLNVNPTTNTTYSVLGTDMNNCINIQTVSVFVDNTCQDVWPGDANSDGTADNLDVLELGLHYTQTGTPRASVSNTWQSYFANNWTGTITNGKNLNHSDCNGDGTIDDNDTLAIFNNYGLTHAFKAEQVAVINPQLSIVPDQAYVTKGNWGTASIYLGDATNQISNINGLAFTVDFDNTLIETNSVYIEYQNSFLDAGQNLHFRKLDFGNGKIFTATTHTVNNNVSGNGLIAKLHYQIKSNLTTDEVLNIGLSQANQSDAAGTTTPLIVGTVTLMAIGASVGMQELNGNNISVSPNPTNGSLTIKSKTELQKIEVISVDGKVLLSEVPTNISYTLHLDNFANGIYFVNLYQNNRIVKREKVVFNK